MFLMLVKAGFTPSEIVTEMTLVGCRVGLRPHKTGDQYEELFKNKCGVKDPDVKTWKVTKGCGKCAVTDFWIKTVVDKPLTFYHCSSSKLPRPMSLCGKNAKCKQGNFKKHFEDELKLKDMKELLQKHATDPKKATSKECLKILSNIEAISYATCSNKDDCFNKGNAVFDYCMKENDPRGKKCKASNQVSVSPKTEKPNAQTSKTNEPKPQTSKTDQPNPQTSKTDQPQVQSSKADVTVSNSNETGNATTSGVAGNNDAIIYATYFVLLILSNIFN